MPYIRIEPQNFFVQIPDKPGVYKIYSLDNNDIPIPLQRVIKLDKSGILYIGKSINLRERLRMLWRVLTPGYEATAHTFGINYNSIEIIRQSFPLNSLAIDFTLNNQPKVLEEELIEEYRQEYGEVPPLNSSK